MELLFAMFVKIINKTTMVGGIKNNMIFNPFSKLKYGDKKQYRRDIRVALFCWYKWEIEPFYKKTIEIYGAFNGNLYRLSVYRWEKWFSPTIHSLSSCPNSNLKLRE